MSYADAKELLSACAAGGDEVPWQEFRHRFEAKLRSGVLRALARCGARARPERVEDLVQETYCKLLEHDGRVLRRCRSRDEVVIGVYLGRVAERVALDCLRADATEKRGGGRVESLELRAELVGEGRWLSTAAEAERLLLYRELKAGFLSSCRRAAGRRRRRNLRILRLAFLEGLTSREISLRLGSLVSPNGIDTVLHRARRRLAREGILVPRRRSTRAVPATS